MGLVWRRLNRPATLPPYAGVLLMQVVEWMDGAASVAKTPGKEAVIIGVMQFQNQGWCSNSRAQQSPLNNRTEMAQGL